jgi:hypothetical protein
MKSLQTQVQSERSCFEAIYMVKFPNCSLQTGWLKTKNRPLALATPILEKVRINGSTPNNLKNGRNCGNTGILGSIIWENFQTFFCRESRKTVSRNVCPFSVGCIDREKARTIWVRTSHDMLLWNYKCGNVYMLSINVSENDGSGFFTSMYAEHANV